MGCALLALQTKPRTYPSLSCFTDPSVRCKAPVYHSKMIRLAAGPRPASRMMSSSILLSRAVSSSPPMVFHIERSESTSLGASAEQRSRYDCASSASSSKSSNPVRALESDRKSDNLLLGCDAGGTVPGDRKSTRLNSSHVRI